MFGPEKFGLPSKPQIRQTLGDMSLFLICSLKFYFTLMQNGPQGRKKQPFTELLCLLEALDIQTYAEGHVSSS